MKQLMLIGEIEEVFEGTNFAFEIVGRKAVSHLLVIEQILYGWIVTFDGIDFECACEDDVVKIIGQYLRAKNRGL